MQIILLDKVVNLGNLGEIVKVKDGYARNFLIPSGRARRATAAAKAEFEAKRAELEKAAAAKLAAAQAEGEKLAGSTVKPRGRLFTDSQPSSVTMRQAVISLRVSVPVLSEQITVVAPRVSTAGRRRTMAWRAAMRCTPMARVMVMTAGRLSGTMPTATATTTIRASPQA